MRTPQEEAQSNDSQELILVAISLGLVVCGEFISAMVVLGSIKIVLWLMPSIGRLYIVQNTAGFIGITLGGMLLSAIATGAFKPRTKRAGATKPAPKPTPSTAEVPTITAESPTSLASVVEAETPIEAAAEPVKEPEPKRQLAIIRWWRNANDWRDKKGTDWLRKGKPIGFVFASYFGGGLLVAGFAASKRKPHPFLLGTLAGIILAVPSSYMATIVMFHRKNAWAILAVWIGWALLIQAAVSTYQSRLIRPSWWIFQFIPDIFTRWHFKRGLKQEIDRLRRERAVANIPIGPTECTSCADEIIRDLCLICTIDTECPKHHSPTRPQYEIHVVRKDDLSRRHLWKEAKRIERRIFWQKDRDTPWALYRRFRDESKTALVVMVDARYGKKSGPRDAVMAMVRLAWGSAENPVLTLQAIQKKPWNVQDMALLLRASKAPKDLGATRDTMDFTMIGIHPDWEKGGKYYDDTVAPFNALLAQCGRLAVDPNIKTRYWTTIMHNLSHTLVTRATHARWQPFCGLEGFVFYEGDHYQPFWKDVPEWHGWLPREDADVFQQVFGDAYEKLFSFEQPSVLRELSALL